MKTIKVANGLDPDQDRHSVGPDLGPNYLQKLSANAQVKVSEVIVKNYPCEFSLL